MAVTKLTRAMEEFHRLKESLAEDRANSKFEIIINQPPPGYHRVKISLDTDPIAPRLNIVKEGKDLLLPDPVTGDLPEVEFSEIHLDASYDDNTGEFSWLCPRNLDPPYGRDEIVSKVRSLLL